jgi:hypothetical protein
MKKNTLYILIIAIIIIYILVKNHPANINNTTLPDPYLGFLPLNLGLNTGSTFIPGINNI